MYSSLILVTFFCLLVSISAHNTKPKVEKCKLCTDLVENFIKGLKRTSKGNFGGGNTDWEDRKLGNYLTSETRFEEIIENICSEFECHRLLEEQEDTLLEWFRKRQANMESQLFAELCTNSLKYCCPPETFGPECSLCPKNVGLTCSGNGHCEGVGTREGSGKCLCDFGYTGHLCQQCSHNFFVEDQNDTFIKCTGCHKSCNGCKGPGANSCSACSTGWLLNEETKVCEDINECLVNEKPCSERQFCENNEGSFVCVDCDASCVSCTARGSDKCLECKQGYASARDANMNLVCKDVDECESDPKICPENERCVNKPGTYKCIAETSTNTSTDNPTKVELDADADVKDYDDYDDYDDNQQDFKEEL